MKTGLEIARLAKEQLTQLTGLTAGTVSALHREADEWHVDIDVVELQRVPDSNDVLATYKAILDDEGILQSYQRTRRFRRDQLMEEEA